MFHRWYWLLVFIICFNLALHAENGRYVLGTNLNLTAGDTNFVGFALPNIKQPFVFFYGAYPTVTLAATGARSILSGSYSYGLERTDVDSNLKHQSQAASLKFSSQISSGWRISLVDSFEVTSDAATFNALRNVAVDPNSPFVFYPVSARISARGNVASLAADYRFTDRSTLSITLSHTLRDYGNGGTGVVGAALANQHRFSGDMTYKYQSGAHETWSMGYTSAYFNFSPYFSLSHFENAYAQTAHVGYVNEIAPGLTLDLTAGVSQIKSEGTAGKYVGYNSTANVQKKIHNSSFSVYFRQASADTSGLGSISNTRGGGASFTHTSRRATLFADASVFDTRGTLDNSFSSRGYAATASLGIPLTQTWSVQVGAQYQRYSGLEAFAFTQKRVFVSLRYSNPTLKKF